MANKIFRTGNIKSMQISPISSYRSNPQTFTGNETMNRRGFLKKAALGVGAVATGAVMAPKALAQQNPQPVAFARESFELAEGSAGIRTTLTLTVGNTRGERTGFDRIWADLVDNHTGNVTKGRVGAVFDIPDKEIHRVACFTLDGQRLVETSNKNVFNWVKRYVDNTARNLSNIQIIRTLR